MKQILADITPMGSNNLFVTHYWPDKQTDPPLHYHEDYMLCLTLHVRGQRIMDDAVEDFTEKDLVLINPGTPHRFKRDAAYADAKCETATVMFSREMPDWKFLSLEHMRPIREMLLPISEIGPRCGFTNVSNFNHLFRAHLGTTPSDYRSRFKTSPLTPDTTN